jgi:hypothetical protein
VKKIDSQYRNQLLVLGWPAEESEWGGCIEGWGKRGGYKDIGAGNYWNVECKFYGNLDSPLWAARKM